LLSRNFCPEIRETFKSFHLEQGRRPTRSGGKGRHGGQGTAGGNGEILHARAEQRAGRRHCNPGPHSHNGWNRFSFRVRARTRKADCNC